MAVADVLVSKLLDLLTSVISSEVEQKVKLVFGAEQEVKMLTNNLQSIQAVLIDAEKRQLKEETVKLWLHRLKDVSYDIDDVLDEWSTEILKSKIEGNEYEYASKPKRAKVWSSVLSFWFSSREVGFSHDVAVKIRDLNERLDVIAKEKERYNLSFIQGSEPIERDITTSFVEVKDVKGRENEKNALTDLLLAQSSVMPNPYVISIVGMGGIGKTTLAKLVYNEDRVDSHFDLRIWVCVSDPFDETRIAKAILEGALKGTTPNLVEFQNILEQIQQYLKGKKFLLVLDDVWNEEFKKWEKLEVSLKSGLPGSKILVTTRKENVAKIMSCREGIFRLGVLPEEECWSIFSQVAFSYRNREGRNKSLEEIGRKIVGKCKGLPLAVKTIGGLLRFKDSIEEWESVLDSELWELEEVERGVLAPLWLSYYDLSSSLKQCFLCCVIYPKDHQMSKKKLIGMWMSQGYLRGTKRKEIEMIGEDHFQNLAMRSFFEDFEVDGSENTNIYCKMHDIMHDFAQSVIKNECFSVEVNQERKVEYFNPSEMHHVGIRLGEGVSFPNSFYNFKRLHSLILLYSSGLPIISLPKIFSEMTCLRTLSLSGCSIKEIPPSISKLIHLRQLDLSDNDELEELPETVCKLYNLQTLDVDNCRRLKLPRDIGKLKNLRCLYNNGHFKSLLPKGIGRLSGLQRLNQINIGPLDEALSLGDIKYLNHLGGFLRVRWQRHLMTDVDVEDAKQAQLKEKKHLATLYLIFNKETSRLTNQKGKELLEALEPCPNLEFLQVFAYPGTEICRPSWLTSLPYLTKLSICEWVKSKQLPPFGNLPSLEYLEIFGFDSLRKAGAELLWMDNGTANAIAFPKLTELKFGRMLEWEEWNEEEEEMTTKIMPCLHTLTLCCCLKLTKLPNYIIQKASVLKVTIWFCTDSLRQHLESSNISFEEQPVAFVER